MILKNIERKEDNTAVFTVEADAAEFEAAVNRAYLNAKKDIHIQGFRKGKAPRAIIEGMYGADTFYQGAFEELAPKAYTFVVEQEELKVVGNPSMDDMSVTEEKGATFTYTVGLYPEVTLGQYKNLEVEVPVMTVTDEDVEKEINTTRSRSARSIPVEDREARMGDTATIDFEGFVDGEAFAGGKGENYPLELGSGTFIPGFEEQLLDKVPGEEVDVHVTFPEQYHSDALAGKAAVFKCKIHEIRVKSAYELDDTFAKEVGGCETFEEMREKMRVSLQAYSDDRGEMDLQDRLIRMAAETMDFQPSDAQIESELDEQINNLKAQLAQQGLELQMYCQFMNTTEEKLREDARGNAVNSVKVQAAIEQIVELENLEATKEEIGEAVAVIARQNHMTVEQLKPFYDAEFEAAVIRSVLTSKVLKLVRDAAEIHLV